MLFKILNSEGRACNGGDLAWTLPTQDDEGTWTPGDWHEIDGDPICCNRGFHLIRARKLFAWVPKSTGDRLNRRIFVAEGGGIACCQKDKAAFKCARLMCEVTLGWPLLPMYPEARAALAMVTADKADLSWADLGGADLGGAYLSGADLSGAYLSGAYLRGAYLRGADLGGAYRPLDPPAGWVVGPGGFLGPVKGKR